MITSKSKNPIFNDMGQQYSFSFEDDYYSAMDPNETLASALDYQITLDIQDNIDYAFNEKALLEEMKEYIDGTYNAHYSQDKYQSTEIIEDMGHGMGFALGNVIKYCQRYGKKDGFNRNDLKKVIHYGIIALAMHDKKHKDKFDYPLPNQD